MQGLGVMLSFLSGNKDSAEAMQAAIGKKIAALDCNEERLRIALEDGSAVELYDDGQSCCERRWLTCDDDLIAFVGAELRGAETRDGEGASQDDKDAYDVHDVAFLVVETSLGAFTVCTHNDHNGYYGGFAVRCRVAR